MTRGADADRFDVIRSIGAVHGAAEHEAWLGYLRSPEVAAVTMTITEAGYRDPATRARLLAGLAARRDADAGPIALVPCDNLPGNGAVVAGLLEGAEPGLAAWIDENVSIVSTVVDRITPRGEPVVTEPYSEWVLSGAFPAGRLSWEDAGATFTDDIMPFEQRKLWLLNGAHSLLTYAGSARGHTTVAEAIADDTCRGWVEQWWDEASPYIAVPTADYRAALLERFANPRIHHRLDQIAADGSQKLPVRIVPVLLLERQAGRMPEGVTRILAAWVDHLRSGAVDDVRGAELVPLADSVPRVLEALDPVLGADDELVAAVDSLL